MTEAMGPALLKSKSVAYASKKIFQGAKNKRGRLSGRVIRAFLRLNSKQILTDITAAISSDFRANAGVQPNSSELNRLANLYSIFPDDLNINALALRVNIYPETNADIANFLLSKLDSKKYNRDDVALMRLFFDHKTRSSTFDPHKFFGIEFRNISSDGVLLDIWRIIFIACVLERPGSLEFLSLDVLNRYLEIEGDPNIVYIVLYSIFDRYNKLDGLPSLASHLKQAKCSGYAENVAIIYFFLVSFGFLDEAFTLEKNHAATPMAFLHPMYIKARLAPKRIAAISALPNKQFSVDPNFLSLVWAWRDAELQKLEIATREGVANNNIRLRAETRDRPHLLVAFFGQMRSPDKTLPNIKKWLVEDFEADVEKIKLTFAVSTWQEAGNKIYLPDGHIDILGGLLPLEAIELLKELGCCTISDVAGFLPSVAHKILQSPSSKKVINGDFLAAILREEIHHRIDPESMYMDYMGKSLEKDFDRNQMIVNQGRMFSRIGAIKGIMRELDEQGSRPSHVLFLRPDLCDLTGSLADKFYRLGSATNWAVVDEDFYAHAIEGVGDRYILADRSAADRIVEIESYARDIIDEKSSQSNLRRKRFEPHQMLRSLLFENSTNVFTVPRREVGWNLFRGDINREAVMFELRSDLNKMVDLKLKSRLERLI